MLTTGVRQQIDCGMGAAVQGGAYYCTAHARLYLHLTYATHKASATTKGVGIAPYSTGYSVPVSLQTSPEESTLCL